jgi:hypothetical protein
MFKRIRQWMTIHSLQVNIATKTIMFTLVCLYIGRIGWNVRQSLGIMSRIGYYTTHEFTKGKHAQLSSKKMVIDIMSVGSKSRINYQLAQKATIGSHESIRFFFNITENDDADPYCADNLQPEDAFAISNFCHKKTWRRYQPLMRYLKSPFARVPFLKKKASPHGWMCAQTRPSHGLGKVLKHYRSMSQQYPGETATDNQPGAEKGRQVLPDYLIVIDDDTFINVPMVQEYLSTFDPNTPRAIAGCLVRSPISRVNFTIPFGGFGMIFSRGKFT